jgi:hypothetical protein
LIVPEPLLLLLLEDEPLDDPAGAGALELELDEPHAAMTSAPPTAAAIAVN